MTLGRVGDYELLASLGAGAHAEVFEARRGAEPPVALKRLYRPLSELPAAARDAFFTEIRAAAALQHPAVVRVLDFGEADERAFVVLELVRGRSLEAALREARTGRLPWALAALIFRDLADALSAAHVQGVLHGDLSLANVLLADDGQAKLIDFGLARLAGTARSAHDATLTGTLQYLAPERLDAEPLTPAGEQWALGVLCWEALVGRYPLAYESPLQLVAELSELPHLAAPGRLVPGLPTELDLLLTQMTQRDPSARLTSLGEVARTLDSLLRLYKANASPRGVAAWLGGTGEPTPKPPSPPSVRAPKPPRQTTSFVGRRPLVQALLQAFSTEPLGAVVAEGAAPGSGRTRLVLAALEALGDGQYARAGGDVSEALRLVREAPDGLLVVDDWPAEAAVRAPKGVRLWVVAPRRLPGVPAFVTPPLEPDEVEALLAARAERPTELSAAVRRRAVAVLGGNAGLTELAAGLLNVEGLAALDALTAQGPRTPAQLSAAVAAALAEDERRVLNDWPRSARPLRLEALEAALPGFDPLDALESLRRRFVVQTWEDAGGLLFFVNPALVWPPGGP